VTAQSGNRPGLFESTPSNQMSSQTPALPISTPFCPRVVLAHLLQIREV